MPKVPCRLCKENVGIKRIRGFYVCSQCHYTYENLVHVTRKRPDNPHVKDALQLADGILDKNEILSALTSYAHRHWKKDDDKSGT